LDPVGSIQAGVDKAIALATTTIIALPGVYNCSLVPGNCAVLFKGHTLTLQSQEGARNTTIWGDGFTTNAGFVFSNSADIPTIDGFTISNFGGAAIYTSANLASFTLKNSFITSNYAFGNPPYAGVNVKVNTNTAVVTIDTVEFSDNAGIALNILSQSGTTPTVTVKSSRFLRNALSGYTGCGITVDNTVALTVQDCIFIKNRGAITANNGALRIR